MEHGRSAAGIPDAGTDAARLWLAARLDRRLRSTMQQLLATLAEELSLATSDAVSIRVLSEDGEWLVPVASHHPDPLVQAALAEITRETARRGDSGLWRRLLDEGRPVRHHTPAGSLPADASPTQRAFADRFPVRAVLAVPVQLDGRVLGGVSLVRLVADVPYNDGDQALLTSFAERVAIVLGLGRPGDGTAAAGGQA